MYKQECSETIVVLSSGNIQLNAAKHGTQSSGESVFIAVAFRQPKDESSVKEAVRVP